MKHIWVYILLDQGTQTDFLLDWLGRPDMALEFWGSGAKILHIDPFDSWGHGGFRTTLVSRTFIVNIESTLFTGTQLLSECFAFRQKHQVYCCKAEVHMWQAPLKNSLLLWPTGITWKRDFLIWSLLFFQEYMVFLTNWIESFQD